jgi:hypothetical protein
VLFIERISSRICDNMKNIYLDYNSIISQTDDYIKMLEFLDIYLPIFNEYIMKMRELKTRFDEVREKLPDLFNY